MANDETTPAATSDDVTMKELLKKLVDVQLAQPIPQKSMAQAIYRTPFNPTGKKRRPKLSRKTLMNGHPLSEAFLTDREILLLNQLKAGKYQNRRWTVTELDGEGTSTVQLFIPNKTQADRIEMAQKGKTLADLLDLIIAEQKSVKAAA